MVIVLFGMALRRGGAHRWDEYPTFPLAVSAEFIHFSAAN
jgi:hypothetical protein